jgi:hypothetical protein
MKLSTENIQFIDNYLKNSEVVYYDIRLEMLDHISSAVEQKMEQENLDFYDAFKSYMVVNKKDILKGNKDGTRVNYSKELFKNFLLFLIKPYMLVGLLGLFSFFYFVEVKNYFSDSFSINNLFFISIISVAFFQIFYFYIFLKERFYVIERTGGVLAILYYAQIIFFPGYGNNESPSNLILTIFFYLLFAYVMYFINEVLKFKKRTKFLFQ